MAGNRGVDESAAPAIRPGQKDMFDKFFGKGKILARARAAERRGEVERAAELYGEADQPEDAARMVLVRADGEPDPRKRLPLYVHAAQLAHADSEVGKEARRKRALLLVAWAGDAATSAVARHELLEAAGELEGIGEFALAADAYARAGDKAGQARALQGGGDVESLEFLLATEAHERRVRQGREERAKTAALLEANGERREALQALEELLAGSDGDGGAGAGREGLDASVRERARHLRARRVTPPLVDVELGGERVTLVLGDEVVVGRSEGTITVPSNAVSRAHVRIFRGDGGTDGAGGHVVVRDLKSRNGTQLRGLDVGFDVPVNDGLELTLGREVPLRIAPCLRLASPPQSHLQSHLRSHPAPHLVGAVRIEIGGRTYVACVGPTILHVTGSAGARQLALRATDDGWVELAARDEAPLYAGAMALSPRITLLAGDALSIERGGPVVVRVAAPTS